MILDKLLKNLIYDPVSVLGLLVFYFLLVNLPISLSAVFKKQSSFTVRLLTILVKKIKTLLLKIYSHENDLNYYLFVFKSSKLDLSSRNVFG